MVGWAGLGWGFCSKTDKQKKTQEPPPLAFFLKERKNQDVMKSRALFYCQIYVSTSQGVLSRSRFCNNITSIHDHNTFWKCEQNIRAMMSAIMEPREIQVSRYRFNELNWTRICAKTHLILKHRDCQYEYFTHFYILCYVYFDWAVSDQLICPRTLASYYRAAPANCSAKAQPWGSFFKQLLLIPLLDTKSKDSRICLSEARGTMPALYCKF